MTFEITTDEEQMIISCWQLEKYFLITRIIAFSQNMKASKTHIPEREYR